MYGLLSCIGHLGWTKVAPSQSPHMHCSFPHNRTMNFPEGKLELWAAGPSPALSLESCPTPRSLCTLPQKPTCSSAKIQSSLHHLAWYSPPRTPYSFGHHIGGRSSTRNVPDATSALLPLVYHSSQGSLKTPPGSTGLWLPGGLVPRDSAYPVAILSFRSSMEAPILLML